MMSSTGKTGYGQSTPDAAAALFGPARAIGPSTSRRPLAPRECGAPVATSTRAPSRNSQEASFDRGYSPEGTARQLAALLATGSLADELRTLRARTLVVHGLDDTLITPSGGQRTASRVPNAELLLVPDIGHDRPEPLWPLLRESLINHTACHP